MKKIFNKNNLTFLTMFASLLLVAFFADIYTRGLINLDTYNFNSLKYRLLWFNFSISWILLILLIVYLLPKNKRIKVFNIISIIINVILFAQVCYVEQMGKFMVFSDLFLAGEGLQYVGSIFVNMHFGMVFIVFLNMIMLSILNRIDRFTIKNANKKKTNKRNYFIIGILIALIIVFRCIAYVSLGNTVSDESWMENYNAKNIYNDYTNPNTSMFVSGFYEYHVRVVYKYFYNLITLDKTALKYKIDKYNSIYGTTTTENEYTGIFKDKNVIVVMMESIDSWIVDEETMPTLSYMMNTGLNFTNRYSPFFNGGQTINSEFAINTGLYAISETDTIYDITDVDYNYSLANMLKNNGYKANSFHANTGSFYNRTNFHKKLGYDNHYSAYDLQESGVLSASINYYQDSNFISDDTLYNYFTSNEKFLSFMTTYSAHLEYVEENKVYKTVDKTLDESKYSKEEYIYRTLASDTDKFLSILIDRLKVDNLLDNTVIVLVSDHYSYGYSDSNYVASKKGVENDRKLLQNTPFVIWSNDIEHKTIDTIMDTADILPTLLNMLGIEYNPNNYMGDDVFSENHDDFVWFSDGTVITGDDCTLSNEAILTKANYNITKNKSILLTNYYGTK